ncbi:MAG TPA: ABC transporter permease subunit [Thermoanaerobaculaceae bacterium]|nr:ABC transporter permease subunit [Thermoanaerobaculaceae bacterium]
MTAWLIARNTFREAMRDRVVAGMVAAGLALFAVTLMASPLALGEGGRLLVDLGLSGISVLGLLVILLTGTSLVAKELERRTIYNLLSRPIRRSAYLVGKWAGLSATLWTVAVLLGLALCGLLLLRGGGHSGPAVLEAVYLAGLELTVVTALAVMFSAISTPVLSALYTLGFFLVGQWSYDLRLFAAKFPPELGTVLRVVANLVPNLPLFNMRTLAAAGETTTALHLGLATVYAAVYAACALCLAAAAFESKDFK